ncbi:MAG TPA: amidohydrolase family protein [Chthoniobacterales bacterium]
MTRYRCRTLITMKGEPITDAAFVIDGERFLEVGPAAEILRNPAGPVQDLGEVVVLPGLVNAHCHLDYTLMRGAILPSHNFSQWVSRINSLKRVFSDDDYLRAHQEGLDELRRFGTTTVLDIAAIPQILPRRPNPVLRSYTFLELIDVRPRPWEDLYAFGSWCIFEPGQANGKLNGSGLSPHAPYTASPELYRLARLGRTQLGLPTTTHVAESEEEFRMFSTGEGPLFDFLKKLGRPMTDCGWTSPLQHLLRNGLVCPDAILVHLNYLDGEDFAVLSWPEWRGLTVVHCPKSHRFLHHGPFPLERLQAAGLNVALGTDSLASNDRLDLFAEMRMVRRGHPDLTAAQALRMATVNGARALRREHELGCIAPGFLADAIAVPCAEKLDCPYEVVLQNRCAVEWMLVNGRVLPVS